METQELVDYIKVIKTTIEAQGLTASVTCWIGYGEEPINLQVKGYQPPIAYSKSISRHWTWEREENFYCSSKDLSATLMAALEFVQSFPSEETRTLEIMVKKIHELLDTLPPGVSRAAQEAWESYREMLLRQAKALSMNGLPKPGDYEKEQTA